MTPDWRPVSEFDAGPIDGVLTDIDDTLTRDGRLSAAVYAAIDALATAGLVVVPVTGRSAGWAHLILRQWPVPAVVAESGGLCLYRDPQGLPRRLLHDAPARIADDRRRLAAAVAQVLREVPGLAIADDNDFRLVDFAIDHSETVVPPAGPDQIARAIASLRAQGCHARASSVHINAWCGDFDKAPMTLRYLQQIRGLTPDDCRRRWAFIGDAPNDASMFAAFPMSVGVANLARHADALEAAPRWLTAASHGDGFIEFARHLLARRTADATPRRPSPHGEPR